jgi:hypothetical protein
MDKLLGITPASVQTFSISQMHIYPNPIVDMLYVDLSGKEVAGTLSILALDGRVMHTQQTSGNSLVSLQLDFLPKGIYLFQLHSSEGVKTVKILKQ